MTDATQHNWFKRNSQWVYIIGGILLTNLILQNTFVRWDLTEEKRYSISPVSKETVRSLEFPMEVTVFLDGEFPIQIKRFQDAIATTLTELKQYAPGRLYINYRDPGEDKAARDSLRAYGFTPVPISVQKSSTELSQKAMYPVIHVRYGSRERYADLLRDFSMPNGEIDLVKAEANLEYKLVSTMRSLIRTSPSTVAFLQGHGEYPLTSIPDDIGQELQRNYRLGVFDMGLSPGLPIDEQIDVLVILQPTKAFSERDKYELDQYLMRGGRILWVLDLEEVDLDVFEKRSTLTKIRELNLDDLLMNYGLKLNADLLMDLQCEPQEFFKEGPSGGSFSSELWPYYPLIRQFQNHPITRNVDQVLLRNAATIDTFYVSGVSKKVLMASSQRSRIKTNVQFIDLNETLLESLNTAVYNEGPQITSVVASGIFPSNFAGRQRPALDSVGYQGESPPFLMQNPMESQGALGIISDGDFLSGKLFRGRRGFSPYDNRTFFLNMLDFLVGDQALTDIRAKEVSIRPLDLEKVKEKAGLIRFVNLGIPILLLILTGFIRNILRKRKYSRMKME